MTLSDTRLFLASLCFFAAGVLTVLLVQYVVRRARTPRVQPKPRVAFVHAQPPRCTRYLYEPGEEITVTTVWANITCPTCRYRMRPWDVYRRPGRCEP